MRLNIEAGLDLRKRLHLFAWNVGLVCTAGGEAVVQKMDPKRLRYG